MLFLGAGVTLAKYTVLWDEVLSKPRVQHIEEPTNST
jgi:hypothetical protein